MKGFGFLVYFLIFTCSQAGFTQSEKSFSEDILGDWAGNGTLFGQEAQFTMKWEQVLNKKFLKLEFKNQFADKSGTERIMTASAYYDVEQKRGYWFDSRAMMLPLILEIDDREMLVFWGDESSEKGKTYYRILKDEISVEDFVFREGQYVKFGEATYTLAKQ